MAPLAAGWALMYVAALELKYKSKPVLWCVNQEHYEFVWVSIEVSLCSLQRDDLVVDKPECAGRFES